MAATASRLSQRQDEDGKGTVMGKALKFYANLAARGRIVCRVILDR